MIQTQIKRNEKQKKERGEEIKKLKELEKEKEYFRGESNFMTLTKLTSFNNPISVGSYLRISLTD